MTNADMSIYLLKEADVGHHLLANRLRTLGQFRAQCVDDVGDLPPPPWRNLILLVPWQRLSAAERQHLLRHATSNSAAALIIIASQFSCDDARQLLHSSQCDLLNMPASIDDLEDAIWRAADGLIRVHHQSAACDAAEQCLAKITPRERDILRSLASGLSNKGTARQLGLSPRTVEVHRANMIRRSEVKNLAELMQMHLTLERLRPQPQDWEQNHGPSVQPCAMAHPDPDPPIRLQAPAVLCGPSTKGSDRIFDAP